MCTHIHAFLTKIQVHFCLGSCEQNCILQDFLLFFCHPTMQGCRNRGEGECEGGGGAHCFHMEVKVAVLNAISQNYNFFEVKLISYASLCLENYLDQFFGKF